MAGGRILSVLTMNAALMDSDAFVTPAWLSASLKWSGRIVTACGRRESALRMADGPRQKVCDYNRQRCLSRSTGQNSWRPCGMQRAALLCAKPGVRNGDSTLGISCDGTPTCQDALEQPSTDELLPPTDYAKKRQTNQKQSPACLLLTFTRSSPVGDTGKDTKPVGIQYGYARVAPSNWCTRMRS